MEKEKKGEVWKRRTIARLFPFPFPHMITHDISVMNLQDVPLEALYVFFSNLLVVEDKFKCET